MRVRKFDQEAVPFILLTGVVGALSLGPAGIGGRDLSSCEEWNTEKRQTAKERSQSPIRGPSASDTTTSSGPPLGTIPRRR